MDFAQKLMSQFVFANSYSQYDETKKRRLSHKEQIEKIRDTLRAFYLEGSPDFGIKPKVTDENKKVVVEQLINEAVDCWIEKKATGSNRFGQLAGDPILKNNNRIYNCAYSPCNRVEFFRQCIYMLLCGTGTGFSVQQHHIDQLPEISPVNKDDIVVHYVMDSIEGWADALDALVCSYFLPNSKQGGSFEQYFGKNVQFDYSLVRPKGAKISGGIGKAPGPEPLSLSLENCRKVLDKATAKGKTKISTIDAYDIVMFAADCVRAGGIRRAATICLFSIEDELMMKAKTGNWYEDNPQRARSNNSVVLVRNEVSQEQFNKIFEYTQQFGEPAFVFVDDKEIGMNPCQPASATIMTKSGESTIGQVKIGDEIWSSEGWTKVVNKWSTGQKEVFEYRAENDNVSAVFLGTATHRVVDSGIKCYAEDAYYIDYLNKPNENQEKDGTPLKIHKETSLGIQEVFDITVDNQSHTYWTGGCNVSNCVEAGFYPYLPEKDLWGWQLCNLSSINMAGVCTIEEWKQRARAATIIGTLQAGFTCFEYVGKTTQEITEREALLGISMTAMSHSPIAFNKEMQKEVMAYCRKINEEVANLIGINPAARLAAIKPEGTGTLALGETASGCHDDHAPKYIRRVTAQKDSPLTKYIQQKCPSMVEESFWSATGTDVLLLFPIDLSEKTVTFKRDVSATDFLRRVKDSVEGWINEGKVVDRCVNKAASHSVSNTVPIFKPSDFDEIKAFVWENKESFVGVSTAGVSGDYAYVDSPLVECEQVLFDTNDPLASWYQRAEDVFVEGCYSDALDSCDTFAVLGSAWDHATQQMKPAVEAYKKVSSKWGAEKWAFYRAMQNIVAEYSEEVGDLSGEKVAEFEEKLSLFIKKLWTRERYNLLRKQLANTHFDFSEVKEYENNTSVSGEVACAGGACLI